MLHENCDMITLALQQQQIMLNKSVHDTFTLARQPVRPMAGNHQLCN
jgi:hypothetical protein